MMMKFFRSLFLKLKSFVLPLTNFLTKLGFCFHGFGKLFVCFKFISNTSVHLVFYKDGVYSHEISSLSLFDLLCYFFSFSAASDGRKYSLTIFPFFASDGQLILDIVLEF